MAYRRTGNDEKYRWVSLKVDREPEYERFTGDELNYRPDCVLEILKKDGTTVIEYERERLAISVRKVGNMIHLPHAVPTARLWVRGNGEMAYKVPSGLKQQDSDQIFMVPAGAVNAELFGDRYFEAVYELINP